ncbi:bacterial regulatory s, gntR family protein [Latilactobacillus fuchuensis DSM 14340 = JCM 11249]|uniref:Bacterial regulatory s, gntR family protein n=2 Tax=Latilactobacillus fuchuensis TaxID=164393 RepID=A0A0R1RZE3_9LACO|nr:bacterial regulatory s, gntR family protein [Latilactobacillus fuchuensis DSM 14340 = JCM 11249]
MDKMAKYKDIATIIRNRILEGVYPTGGLLPEQIKLAQEFQTSRMTIQKALEILNFEGLIYSTQGKGTFIKSNAASLSRLDTSINQYVGTTELFKDQAVVKSQILKNELRLPNADEQDKLQLTKTDAVYDIIRVRYLDTAPYCIEHSVMPAKILGDLTDNILKESIYAYLENQLNFKIGAAYRKISADQPNQMDQEYLKCAITEPVLQVEQTVFLQTGEPFEYSTTRHRFDKGSITTINMGNARAN